MTYISQAPFQGTQGVSARLLKVPHRCPHTPKAQETRVLVPDLQVRPVRQQAHVQGGPPSGAGVPLRNAGGEHHLPAA